ncbi:exonuclease SbcD [Psychrobacter frigidicola]|uniref:Exonuclease SbcD n=1 Tax=Psychrobacter frigidicola TaxID=45611 RepID=A0A5C7AAC1_9GAMM|nr:AAA family ATPase [Psychrobacter frigidicola]TXD97763.1 exonuclease SbcD [Psychrobacter frigidicola]
MRLIELRLKNLNSLKGEWHIDFTDPAFVNEGIFAITGQTGAGKTTILDAICLALYSQTPRLGDITASSNEMMTQGTGECSAEVIIEISGKHYRCFWYQHRAHKKAKGNLLPIRHEISDVETGDILEDAKSKTTPFIKDLIGMDFSQFTRSIMLAQGGFAAFLKSETWERAAILEKITGTAIYAQISKNVFEKKRDMEHKLAKLQAGVDSLPLLSAEDEAQLIIDLQTQQSLQKKQRQDFDTVTKQLGWLEDVAQLKQSLAQNLTTLTSATQDEQDFIPNALRLNAANKALEIESAFQALTHSRDTSKQLKNEQQGLLDKTSTQTTLLEKSTANFDAANTSESQLANELRDTQPIIDNVRQLDAKIQQHIHTLAADNQRKNTLTSSIQRLSQEISSHQSAEQDIKSELTCIASYLSERSALNNIDSDIITFNNNCTRMKSLLQINIQSSDNKQAYQNANSKLQKQLSTLNQQQEADDKIIGEKQHAFKELQYQQSVLLQDKSLNGLRAHIDYIDALMQHNEQVRLGLQQLADVSEKITIVSKAVPDIQRALSALKDTIARHESDIKGAKNQRQDKQYYLEALQKVANLENYIIELQDGTPCPLCGALEHPYGDEHPLLDSHDSQHETSLTEQTREQIANIDTRIDNMTHELSDSQGQYAGKQNQLQHENNQLAILRMQAQTLCTDINSHIKNDINAISVAMSSSANDTAINTIVQTIKDMSNEILPIVAQHLAGDVVDSIGTDQQLLSHLLSTVNDTKSALNQEKENIKTTLNQYDSLTQKLSETTKTLDNAQKQQQHYYNDNNKITTDIKLNTQRIDDIDNVLQASFVELTTVTAAVATVVETYPADKYQNHLSKISNKGLSDGVITDSSPIKDTLLILNSSVQDKKIVNQQDSDAHIGYLRQFSLGLTQLKQYFHTQKDNTQTLQTESGKLSTLIETKQVQLNNENTALNKLNNGIEEQTTALKQLQGDRTQKFADKNPDKESNRLHEALDNAKSKKVEAQRQLDNSEQALLQLRSRTQQLSTDLIRISSTLNTQESGFSSLLMQSQFATETDFFNARLPKATRDSLQQQYASIEQSLNHANMQLKQTQHTLDEKVTLALTELTDENRDSLASKHTELTLETEQRLGTIGAIKQRLRDNEKQKMAQTTQNIAINAQKEALQVWQQLDELIGSSSGKKYRNFAQGLTFKIMIDHANIQLEKMSNRYLLTPDITNPLELNVIDNYQGGDVRSTKNLSGGEGFIISLALALGLSQMASQNTRVDSLFLDEGFGTLDEESLDIALDTLTNLQQEGKIIGIISHVQALKARIFTQIHVKKLSGGFSEITGQGCHKIAS